jgi:iron complex outermembrane receptor protein
VLEDGGTPGYEDGEQGEVGLKTQLLDDRLLGTMTFYHLTKSNVAVPVPSRDFTAVAQVGEARSRGIEVDVTGHITDSWSVIGSYAFTDARFTEDVPGGLFGGQRLRNTPEHAFSLWSKYEWPFGLGLGAGVFGATERELDDQNTVDVPGFVRVDATASYKWNLGPSRLIAQFNVFNVLDKEIFSAETSFTSTINAVPVAPRTFLGSLRLEW